MTSLNDNETLLLQEILRYASAFLEENKEFYPFGMVMEHNHEIYSVSASDNEDYPNSQDLITIFENCFSKELNKGNYILCAICFDIHLKDIINGIEHKKDAINVRFITRNISKDIILSYIFNPDETVVFK